MNYIALKNSMIYHNTLFSRYRMDDDALLDIAKVCKYLNLSRSTFHRIRKVGNFPSPYLIGEKQLWRKSDIDAYLEKTRERNEK